MFEFFRGRKTIPKPPPPNTTVAIPVVQEAITIPSFVIPGLVMLKPKKWVRRGEDIGIVTKIDSSGYVTVDLVNDIGETRATIRVPAGQVVLARYKEIPANRRGDQALAATKGYV